MKDLMRNHIVNRLFHILGKDESLHLVGGAVRDFLLNKEPKDFDFATKLRPQEMVRLFQANHIHFIETGIRRGTLTAMIDHQPVEVTTFRNYENENTFTNTIEEDLSARDFTINAIAVNVATGKVVDPFKGEQDLKDGVLRAVGDATKRFTEDPHRMIRAIRFIAKLELVPAENLLKDITAMAEDVQGIAKERIHDELVKILMMEDALAVVRAFRLMRVTKILDQIIPELVECIGVEQNGFHLFDVFDHIMSVLGKTLPVLELRLAALLHDVAKPKTVTVGEDGVRHFLTHEDVGAEMATEILTRLKFPTATIKQVHVLIKEHMRSTDMGPKGVRRLIKELGDLLPLWLELKHADKMGGRPEEILEKFKDKWEVFLARLEHEMNRKETHPFETLAIGGKDILNAGVKQGPEVGKILNEFMELVLDNPELNTRDELLHRLEERLA